MNQQGPFSAHLAEELKNEINVNDDKSTDEYGWIRGRGFGKETVTRLYIAHQLIEAAGVLAKEFEWMYSGDSSSSDFYSLLDVVMVEQINRLSQEFNALISVEISQ